LKEVSNILIIAGIVIVVLGLLLRFTSVLSYFGKLPGDIKIEKENFKFYFPITSLIILSVIVNVIIRIFKK